MPKVNKKNFAPHKKSVKNKSESFKPFQKNENNKNKFVSKHKKQDGSKKPNKLALLAERRAELKASKERAIQERKEQVAKYKKQRLEKTKAISKKTQRGQPLMKNRMELLLKQIIDSKT